MKCGGEKVYSPHTPDGYFFPMKSWEGTPAPDQNFIRKDPQDSCLSITKRYRQNDRHRTALPPASMTSGGGHTSTLDRAPWGSAVWKGADAQQKRSANHPLLLTLYHDVNPMSRVSLPGGGARNVFASRVPRSDMVRQKTPSMSF